MGSKKLAISTRVKHISISFSRLALTTVATFGIGVGSIYDRYNNYWDKTIFRVQTVDFNILSHTLPTKLSYSIIQNQPKEIQRTLNSNYNLFGLVVTDPSGQKIVAASKKDGAPTPVINLQQIQKSPYDLLLDPPPLFPQWSYSDSHATERTATNFTNRGRVIGRVYYVRGERPSFREDFSKWLSNPISQSSRVELYTMTMLACLGGGFAFWSLWEYLLYKKRVQKRIAQQIEAELNQQNETLNLQLQERVDKSQLMQEEWEKERLSSLTQAEELRARNQQLQQEISQLKTTINSLPTQINSQTQTELLKIKSEAQVAKQKQQQQEEQVKQLNQQLQVYQNQIVKIQKHEAEFAELQLQIEATRKARSLAESQLEQVLKSDRASQQKQYQQKQELKQLNQQLEVYQHQLEEFNRQKIELKQLQSQVEVTKQARSFAELQTEELRNNERHLVQMKATLEQQLANEQELKSQLSRQLEVLQQALLKSQQQERESQDSVERANEQMQILIAESERLKEDMGKHSLNDFEKAILQALESSSLQLETFSQFDAGTGRSNSKFVDFVVVTDNCLVAIEAKSYKGIIESVGDPRNTDWTCQTNTAKVLVNACWGVNPYHQVKAYVDSLRSRVNPSNKNRYKKVPTYGVVVFPTGAQISSNITTNIGGYFRIVSLDQLLDTVAEFNNQSQNRSNFTQEQTIRLLKGMPCRIAA